MQRIAILGVLLLVACLPACTRGARPTPPPDDSIFALTVGDCFNDAPAAQETGLLSEAATIPCDQPHDNEVFHRVAYPADAVAPFPGTAEIERFAQPQCETAFAEYVGKPYAESVLVLVPLMPSDISWADGDRDILCALFAPPDATGAFPQLVGSKKGSGE